MATSLSPEETPSQRSHRHKSKHKSKHKDRKSDKRSSSSHHSLKHKSSKRKSRKSTTGDNDNSALLSLPPELRSMIYNLVFEGCELKLTSSSGGTRNHIPQSIGLLLACRSIYSEVIDIYYNSLSIETPLLCVFTAWAQKVCVNRTQQIAKLSLWVPETEVYLTLSPRNFDHPAARKIVRDAVNGLHQQGVLISAEKFALEIRGFRRGVATTLGEYFQGHVTRHGE